MGQKVYVDSIKVTGWSLTCIQLVQEDLFWRLPGVTALKRGQANRIVLTRPAVEAVESFLVSLPGDLKEKGGLTSSSL